MKDEPTPKIVDVKKIKFSTKIYIQKKVKIQLDNARRKVYEANLKKTY
ncbi:MAG: hypothetical protein ACFFDN_19475 [Candidatus Hodarchaeota archaeon]